MAHELAALWLAAALGGAAPAFADPPAVPDGETHPVALSTPEAGTAPSGKTLWGKGQILPPEHRTAKLSDWDRYGLPPAPAGHQWVSVGQNAYIVDLASGEIAGAFIGVLTN
jgi:Ni/Co efflux regulator RcnB